MTALCRRFPRRDANDFYIERAPEPVTLHWLLKPYIFTRIETNDDVDCRDCQKWSGSAFSSNIVIPRMIFKVTKGNPKCWVTSGDSGRSKKNFCMWLPTQSYSDHSV